MNHSFNVDVAVMLGIPCAVILDHINFWIRKNEANNKHYHDGTYWTYNSVKAFGELFPYLTDKQIRTALEKLQSEGLVKTGNYNENPYDRTLWYAITQKGKSMCRYGQMEMPEEANQFDQQGEPIPDIKPDIKPDNAGEANPFGDSDYEPDTNTVEVYASTHLHHMSPTNMDDLVWFKTKMQDDLIRYAIDEACAQGVRTFAYVRSILNRYVRDEIRSLDEIKAIEARRERERGNQDEVPEQPVRWLA